MEIRNFALLKGDGVKFEKGRIEIPSPKTIKNGDTESSEDRPSIEVRTDAMFSNGTIEFKFKSSHIDTGIILLFNTPNEEGIAIGLSSTHQTFLISEGIHKFIPISKAGSFKNYSLEEEHIIKIEIKGSYGKLYMDNVLLCESKINIKESIITFRLSSKGHFTVYDIKVHAIKPKVFVVMQFTNEYNELFQDVIKPITESMGFECIRADEFYTGTPILRDIIESIQNSTAIIAEITPDNPNVFYEIGYSHAINKPTILLCDKKREKLPFDLSSFRCLFYDNTIAGKKKVEENLKKYLENIK